MYLLLLNDGLGLGYTCVLENGFGLTRNILIDFISLRSYRIASAFLWFSESFNNKVPISDLLYLLLLNDGLGLGYNPVLKDLNELIIKLKH